nr:PREDICTED: uncharacterized protein LOC102364573 [Latimeria chalumnae]|eukprot:XP_006008202.1 PREDICTED: uncharacterized protein LOC102364573 [Latimeria chalumnae]
MAFVNGTNVKQFVDAFNTATEQQANTSLPADVRTELLSQVLNITEPILRHANDEEFLMWMNKLKNLLPGLKEPLVSSLFTVVKSKNCTAISKGVNTLNSIYDQLDNSVQRDIYDGLLKLTKDPPLRCFNNNSSFPVYLNSTFQSYGKFLTLTDVAQMLPATVTPNELLRSTSASEVADVFAKPGFLNNNNILMDFLMIYNKRSEFIEEFNKKDLNVLIDIAQVVFIAGIFALCVAKLNEKMAEFKGKEQEIYNSIKAYLTQSDVSKPRCYNASDHKTASWFNDYLGKFISYSSEDDIRIFADSEATLQKMSTNEENLKLITKVALPNDVSKFYASLLLAENPDFNISSLPNQLLCFATNSNGFKDLKKEQILNLAKKKNKICSPANETAVTEPSTAELQFAAALVEGLTNITTSNVESLGQNAVGLSETQIGNINDDVQGRQICL